MAGTGTSLRRRYTVNIVSGRETTRRVVSRPAPDSGYCEQGAVSTLPASTRSVGAFAVDAVDEGSVVVVVDEGDELPDCSTVPVSSTFLPTCGLNAVGLAIRRYIDATGGADPA